MSDQWFYVENGERQGPISVAEMESLIGAKKIEAQTFIWKKGFDNWTKLEEVKEFNSNEPSIPAPISEQKDFNLSSINQEKKIFFIKIGADRGTAEIEYGPFNIKTLIKLFSENRLNAKTFIFSKGLVDWKPLGDLDGFEQVFHSEPPIISDDDRRAFKRKPLIARMFIHNNNDLFEGICRDLSIGGMQVLVDHFPVEAGERISINVHPDNTDYHFVASGEIVRKLEGNLGFSFRFINLSEEAQSSINSYIANEG